MLGAEDLGQDSGAGGGLGFLHDVLDVLFDCLFGDPKRVRDLLVCPALSEMFDHSLLAVGELKSLLGLLRAGLLPASDPRLDQLLA